MSVAPIQADGVVERRMHRPMAYRVTYLIIQQNNRFRLSEDGRRVPVQRDHSFIVNRHIMFSYMLRSWIFFPILSSYFKGSLFSAYHDNPRMIWIKGMKCAIRAIRMIRKVHIERQNPCVRRSESSEPFIAIRTVRTGRFLSLKFAPGITP